MVRINEPIIKFDNVSFAYPARLNVPAVRNINSTIHLCESIGICGASGSGKSLIIALVERFYNVISGKLTINGIVLPALDVYRH